jgi:hypothetical protein
MNTRENNSKSKSSLIILIIVLTIYSILVISANHYERLTADSTLYINIAEKYLRGEFGDAVNGYWGPMLSWLLIPFLYLNTSHVFAINALNLIVGLFTIIGVWFLSFRFEISEKIRSAILISFLPIILFISTVELFDFLLLCFLVYYLNIIFNNEYPRRIYNGLLCGVLGAVAYFSKSYAFPFFIVHFTFMNIAHYIRCESKEKKNKVLRNAIAGIVLFSIVSGAWIAVISNKYNHFTISNMGKANFSGMAPGLPDTGLELGNPMFYEGFIPPSNKTAVSAWEDPSYILDKLPIWNPVESIAYLKHFIKNISKNVIECIRIFGSFSRLSFAIIIAYILLLIVQLFNRQILRGDMLYSFFTLLLFTGGYMPFHFELRYLWIDNILLLLMGGYVLTMLFQNTFFKNNFRKNILIIFFVLSFMLTPLKSFVQAGHDNINKEMYTLSLILKDRYNIHGKIASNREWEHVAIHDSWHKTFRLAYWLNSKYFGQAKEDVTAKELEREFKKYNLDYYFFWGQSDSTSRLLSHYREVTNGEIEGLKIYSLKDKIIEKN